MPARNVVVTGFAVATCLGTTPQTFWNALIEGQVGTRPVRRFPTDEYCSQMGGEVGGLPTSSEFPAAGEVQRGTELALAVARAAAAHAGLTRDDVGCLAARAGIVMGTVVGNRPLLEPVAGQLHRGEDAHLCFASHRAEWLARAPALELGLRGVCSVVPVACAAGNAAIGQAAQAIQYGEADVMLAGGADELSPAMYMMFSQHHALSPDVVRPFDRDRQGLILSEGAAILVLEAEEHARARGATRHARVAGYGTFADAHDMTHPEPGGIGARLSMQAALEDAQLSPADIDYINAHGTGTPANDGIEARAIRAAFGSHDVAVSATKSMTGHCQGAAAAIEAVACVLAIRDGCIPATVNHRVTDAECPINLVTGTSRRTRIRSAMNNAFGFGGNIACTVFCEA